jgi:hypothetical protein
MKGGSLYKIVSKNPEIKDFYIGMTTRSIKGRTIQHKSDSKRKDTKLYRFVRENGNWDNFEVKLIVEYDDIDKRALMDKELHLIIELKPSLNTMYL